MDANTRKKLRSWRAVALVLLVWDTVRAWLSLVLDGHEGALFAGGLVVAVAWTLLAAWLGLVALAEVRWERR